jgi:hypothetical protein
METNRLSSEEYQNTFQAPMRNVTSSAEPVLDIWPYVESVPVADLGGYILSDGLVEYVYQHPEERFLHVLVSTDNRDVFLVIIIDLTSVKIHGHYLLDLLKEYQITPEPY